ncbi:histidine kinase [Metabacillus litoralis]|uniref:histidine kinase n=1 Tax=Metabacillus litoralis TaxID=152268 RepID=UPI000EF5EBD6|nr:histidine kinase [Metabacillus litoralis]
MRLTFNRMLQLLVIISIIFVLYIIILNYKYPYVGARIIETNNEEMLISEIEPKTWAEKVGIHVGDTIIEINNKDPQLHDPAVSHGLLEQINSVKVLSTNGITKEYIVPSTLFNNQVLFIIIIPLTVLALCLFSIYFINKSNKEKNQRSAHLLILFLLIIAMAYISASGSSRGDLLSRYVNIALFTLVPVSYLHFIYQYFKELGKELFNFSYIIFGYMLVLINILSEIVHNFWGMTIISNRLLTLLSFLILLILTFSLKFSGLRKIRYSEQAYLVKILIVTNVLAFTPFLLFYVIPYVIFQKYVFSPIFLSAFLLLIPFSLVYQFLVTKIYDIEFLLGRLKYYSILAIIPTLIMVMIMFTLKDSNSTFNSVQLFVYIYLAMVFIFYVKEVLDDRFRLKRISEKYNYQDSIFKYTQSIRKASNLEQVIAQLKQVIVDVLHVSKAYFIELDKVKNIASVDPLAKESNYRAYLKEIKEASNEVGKIVEVDKGFVINIGVTDNKSYVLVCLSILNTPKLTRDEVSWLKTLSFYTNVSLENFLKIDELMQHLQKVETEEGKPDWLNKILFSIEEKQRSHLAKEIHDSVLQDLVSLKRQCELAMLEEDADVLKKQLQSINSSMTKVIKETRETCQELRPQLLYDLGLVKALNKLIMQYQDIVDFDIRLNTGNINVALDIDTQLNLYRIIQELLINAHKHSEATNVMIILVCIKDKIVLHYEDNGIGFNYEEIADQKERTGLSGISERVKALKGSFLIETSRENGLKIDIEI